MKTLAISLVTLVGVIAPASGAPAPSRVAHGGVTLTSTSIDLPLDETAYPDGPNADAVNANCTACHSASMALTQPPLTPDQWRAEVTKMADTYKAPIDKQDMPAIVAYLTAMSAREAAKTR